MNGLQHLATERTAVVVAHPDDEVIGAATLLPRLRDGWFVYVTDGAPRDGADAARHGLDVAGYREVRRRERADALARCGIPPGRIFDLDCPDQQAALRLAQLSRELAAFFDAQRIAGVLTQPYEGGHPDHDATAFVVHAAAALAGQPPQLYEMTSYHRGPHGLAVCEFLQNGEAPITVRLTPDEQRAKQALIACHASQRDTLHAYPLELERYRRAPRYDFTRAPHEGPPWYEGRGWGVSGAQFRELAAQGRVELGLREP
jgi:LmbE family N-acetylglucosaminyl deacetylase